MKLEAQSSMQFEALFEAALGVSSPWYVCGSTFDVKAGTLTIRIDSHLGSRFNHRSVAGEHPAHDTLTKRYRHLKFFQHECFLEVRVPRVKLPDGFGAATRAAVGGQAQWLHLAVRGAGAEPVPGDALCGCRPAGG